MMNPFALPAVVAIRRADTFLMESQFLRELVGELTPTPDEQMVFLTGPKLNRLRVVCRRAPAAALESQSPVFVRSSALAVARVLVPIIEQGAELHVVAHSHPGRGAGATFPSRIDIACLGRLQRSGSPAIGLIVTRDSHLQFFSVRRPFRVALTGNGITKITEHIFHLDEIDTHENIAPVGPAVPSDSPATTDCGL